MDIDGISSIRGSLLTLMEQISSDKDYDILILMLTDIINEGSEILFTGKSKDVMSKAFNVSKDKNAIYLPGIVSRKKQVIPPIASSILSGSF
jgi:manganese-dependent inorganic pyrophosphatase